MSGSSCCRWLTSGRARRNKPPLLRKMKQVRAGSVLALFPTGSFGTRRTAFGYSGSERWRATMAERFTRKVTELRRSMLTAIGLQLRQQLDTSEQLPPALAALPVSPIRRG